MPAIKPRVALFFGTHEKAHVLFPADKAFFARIGPFLERQVEEGRQITLLLEIIFAEDIPDSLKRRLAEESGPSREARTQYFQQRLDNRVHFFNDIVFAHSVNEGLPEAMGGRFLDPLQRIRWGTWGFEETVLAINRREPERITVMIEPQFPESTYYAVWKKDLMDSHSHGDLEAPDYLQRVMGYICIEADYLIRRDRGIRDLACQLAGEDPNLAVVIPRGTDHRGMAALFDAASFEMTVQDSGVQSDFIREAAALGYTQPLDDATLERYARLHQDYERFFRDQNPVSILSSVLGTALQGQHRSPSMDDLHARARRYALERNPD